jgi:hypothetical protein
MGVGGKSALMDVTASAMDVGRSTLTGWQRPLVRTVARPVARRTRFTEEQIEAAIGLAVFAFAAYRLLRPLVRALRGRDR